MLRIICAFLGVFCGAVLITGTTGTFWEALSTHHFHAAGQLLGELLFLSTRGAMGGMIGAAAGFLVGWVLDWLTLLGTNDCPRSCDDHFMNAKPVK